MQKVEAIFYIRPADKPHNPLLNSGAIMSAAILLNRVNDRKILKTNTLVFYLFFLAFFQVHPEMKLSEKFDFVTDYIRRIGGGEFLGFNNSGILRKDLSFPNKFKCFFLVKFLVFLSERETADRNYALTYYMKENK